MHVGVDRNRRRRAADSQLEAPPVEIGHYEKRHQLGIQIGWRLPGSDVQHHAHDSKEHGLDARLYGGEMQTVTPFHQHRAK